MDYAERIPIDRAIEAQISAVPGVEGRTAFVLVVLRDFTQQRRLEEMRADFVANASHELRTPLASVLGFVETLQGPAKNDPVARDKFLDIMRAQATRMSRLIDDLLSLSRIELNAHVRPDKPIDLATIVGHVADTLAPWRWKGGRDPARRGRAARSPRRAGRADPRLRESRRERDQIRRLGQARRHHPC